MVQLPVVVGGGGSFVQCLPVTKEAQGSVLAPHKPDIVEHTGNLGTREVKAGGSEL